VPEIDPVDEQRHDPDDSLLWNESFYLDWFSPDGALGGYVRIGFVPGLQRVWYWACVVGAGRPLVTVIDHDVPLPRDPRSFDLKYDGLAADYSVDHPLEQVSCNLEAFALSLDDPAGVYHGAYGERLPFGFELDWTTDRAGYQWPPVTPRYEIPCRVHGEVKVGREVIKVDGWGQRDHSWGAARDWWAMPWCWSAGRLDDGTRWHTAGGFFPEQPWGVAYELPGGSTEFIESDSIEIEQVSGREGLVERARLRFGALDLEVEPQAWSPVLLTHPDGREDRFPRALSRVTASDGRKGHCWIEFNQPPSP